ncbi:MAG TPA: rod shape-determining protein RodA [Gammaproteobacteria bacterium]|nr:rod shape-determining protein RodA [Gammaproteobacteria bacterium]
MDKRESLWLRIHIDPILLVCIFILCAAGLAVLYSATGQDQQMVARQGGRMLLGLFIMAGVAQFKPETLTRLAPWLYAAGMILLVVLNFAGTGRGAHRWLDLGVVRFQPAEIMKLAVPMTCARFLTVDGLPPSWARLTLSGLFILLPVILIAVQPDLGTAVLVMAAGGFVIFLGGLSWRVLLALVVIVAASTVPLWSLLHDYQRQRILTLLDPQQDPLGAGYHIIQSVIAVGSGGLFGKGWLQGTQSRLEFLPERHTDFIFAVVCEEFGFAGAALLIGMYLLIIARGLSIASEAQDHASRLLAGSLALTLFIYVFVNMGMVVGQLPVVGVPLPMISYGGSSLVTLMAAFGMLMSVHTHRKKMLF